MANLFSFFKSVFSCLRDIVKIGSYTTAWRPTPMQSLT